MSKPFSQACENNKSVILAQLKNYFRIGENILEIGSGTAQHLRYFSEHMPTINWLPSDIPENIQTLINGLEGVEKANIKTPIELDVMQENWLIESVDGVFSANSLHIMPLSAVAVFFSGVGRILKPGGYLCVYGPFKYEGEFTSASNAEFQLWLRNRDKQSGIRDFEAVNKFALEAGLILVQDKAMPANNQFIVWQKKPSY